MNEQTGLKIRTIRAYREMTQAELAVALGISRQTVVSIENGAVLPNPLLMKKMETVLNVRFKDVDAAFSVFETT